jgi:hypothetical protein
MNPTLYRQVAEMDGTAVLEPVSTLNQITERVSFDEMPLSDAFIATNVEPEVN